MLEHAVGVEAALKFDQAVVGCGAKRRRRAVLVVLVEEVEVDAGVVWLEAGDERPRPGGLGVADRLVRQPDGVDVELVGHVAT